MLNKLTGPVAISMAILSMAMLMPRSLAASPASLSAPVERSASPQRRYAITAQDVASAVSAAGAPISSGEVALLAKVVATDPDPLLDIKAVEPPRTEEFEVRSRVKLACHLAGQCLPFYVEVIWPAGKQGLTISAAAVRSAASPETRVDRDVTMRAGAHATLLLDDDHTRIQVAVVSLENGIAGHRIRVASPDRKQVYYAEVVSAVLLKGSF